MIDGAVSPSYSWGKLAKAGEIYLETGPGFGSSGTPVSSPCVRLAPVPLATAVWNALSKTLRIQDLRLAFFTLNSPFLKKKNRKEKKTSPSVTDERPCLESDKTHQLCSHDAVSTSLSAFLHHEKNCVALYLPLLLILCLSLSY